MGAEMIISLVVGIVMSMASAAASKSAAESERRYNSEEAQINRDWQHNERLETQGYNTDMWNESNKRNSIGEVLGRGRDAGVSASAILGGSYKDATASPVTSSPTGGAQATSNALSTLISSALGSMPSMLNSPSTIFKNIGDTVNAREMLSYNQKLINASIDEKYASTKQMLSQAGLNDVKVEEVKANLSWIGKLNEAELKEKLAKTTLLYNQSKHILQQIEESKQNIVESDARIERMTYQNAESAANADYTLNSTDKVIVETQGQKIDNLIQSEILTQEELQVAESRMRYNLACQLGIPLGSSEFEFNYALWKSGQLESYCDSVIVPTMQSTWKPNDFTLPDKIPTMLPFNGRLGLGGSYGYDFWHNQLGSLANYMSIF